MKEHRRKDCGHRRCGAVYYNGPGVYQAAEDENDLGAYMAAMQRGET